HLEAPPPCLPPGGIGLEEVREFDRPLLRPDAPRAAEIRNARLRADAGAGEDRDAVGGVDHAGELGLIWVHRSVRRSGEDRRLRLQPPARNAIGCSQAARHVTLSLCPILHFSWRLCWP